MGDYGSYYHLMHTAPVAAHTPAKPDYKRQPMRWKPLRNGSPCGTGDSCDARCGFAPPGTCCRVKAQSATSFRLTDRNGVLIGSAAVRCGVPVFTIERVCIVEASALRRPTGAC